MKQFLRSTAVFACVALMFCACSDDGTEDSLTSADLGITSIKSVSPGEERAWVKWTVPGNENIASCELTWTNDKGESGEMIFDAVEGIMETDKDSDLQGLSVGQYTFTIKSISKSGVTSSTSTESVYVYNESTYTQRPNPSQIVIDDDGATIFWSDIPADCYSVDINYKSTIIGDYLDTGEIVISADEPTVIPNVEPSSIFSFRTYFLPNAGLDNEGLDPIEVAEDQENDYMFPDTPPTAPLSLYACPGNGRFEVYWTVANVADITASYITVSDGSKVVVSGSNLKKGASNKNTVEFSGLEPGTYTISVYNSKSTDTESDVVTTDVTVYNKSTYSDYTAKVKQDITLTTSQLEIAWDYSLIPADILEDCLGVVAKVTSDGTTKGTSMGDEYQVGDEEEYLYAQDEIPAWSYISGVESGWNVAYTTYFCPADGLDIIDVYGSEEAAARNTVPSTTSPSKLENVSFIPGDYSIFLEFDVPNDTDINEIKIWWEDVTGSSDPKTITIEKANIKYGRDNFTSISLSDGLEIDAKYNVKIWTETTDDTPSAYELGESILVYDLSIFKQDCATPTLSPVFGDSYPYGVEITWTQDERDEEVDYVNFTYVYNTNGDVQTVKIYDISTTTLLPDVMPGTAYSYNAVCTPALNAMDDVATTVVSGTFPYVRVDKSLITEYPMDGDAVMDSSSDYTSFDFVYDDLFSLSTTASMSNAGVPTLSSIQKYLTTSGQKDKTLTYDLGAVYKLAEFYYTPYYGYAYAGFHTSAVYYNNTLKTFSLWGIGDDSEPKNDAELSRLNSDGTPDLEDWKCLISNATVPDLLSSEYSTETDSYDYNGDGVVGVDDLYYAILYLGGLKIEIPEENRVPTRYIRLQFHTAANETSAAVALADGTTTTDYSSTFHIVELDHTHMGCDVE